jgi:GTPase SAR1 family protein
MVDNFSAGNNVPSQGENYVAHKLVILGDVAVGKSSIAQR